MGKVLRPVAVAITLSLMWACSSGPQAPDNTAYTNDLVAARTDKDEAFKIATDSPIPTEKRSALLPLKYFPVDPEFAVPASLKLSNERPVFEMPTSTGTLRRMQLVGELQFSLQGKPHSLGAFIEDGAQEITRLFVPFADLTTGKDTYSAGRYLDIDPTRTGYYTIDFNRAYNPYCAYNSTYECPYPPPSNRLSVAVTAGEKDPGA